MMAAAAGAGEDARAMTLMSNETAAHVMCDAFQSMFYDAVRGRGTPDLDWAVTQLEKGLANGTRFDNSRWHIPSNDEPARAFRTPTPLWAWIVFACQHARRSGCDSIVQRLFHVLMKTGCDTPEQLNMRRHRQSLVDIAATLSTPLPFQLLASQAPRLQLLIQRCATPHPDGKPACGKLLSVESLLASGAVGCDAVWAQVTTGDLARQLLDEAHHVACRNICEHAQVRTIEWPLDCALSRYSGESRALWLIRHLPPLALTRNLHACIDRRFLSANVIRALLHRVPDFDLHEEFHSIHGVCTIKSLLDDRACTDAELTREIQAKVNQFGPTYSADAARIVMTCLREHATVSIYHDPVDVFAIVLGYAALPLDLAVRPTPMAAAAAATAVSSIPLAGRKRKADVLSDEHSV
jgi:hypothetical protein